MAAILCLLRQNCLAGTIEKTRRRFECDTRSPETLRTFVTQISSMWNRSITAWVARLGAVVALLSGCAVGPHYRAPDAATSGAASPFVSTGPAAAGDLSAWWQKFSDPTLNELVARTLAGSLDIAQAAARVKQAEAGAVSARAGYFPSITGSNSAARNMRSDAPDGSAFSGGASARWEIDLFGRLRRSAEAARADLDAAGYSLDDVRTAVAAETARTYVNLVSARARLAIARDTVKSQEETLEIARFRAAAGLVSALDVEQARSQRAQTAASTPALERSEAAARFRLAVLSGAAPGALDALLGAASAIPAAPKIAGAGLPAELLRRRPDVRAAERSLAAATARVGVAEAERLPSLILSGEISSSASALRLFGDSWASSLAASLSQPLFRGGALNAAVKQRRAVVEQQLGAYKAAVLGALEEVENALVTRETAQRRVAALAEQVDSATAAAELARANYRAGLTDFQRLLDAERTLLQARDGLATAETDLALAAIQLFAALGGGWSGAATGA